MLDKDSNTLYNVAQAQHYRVKQVSDDQFMDTEAVAKELGISPSHVRVILGRRPELRPKRKFGQQWMFTPEELERLRLRKRKPRKN